jgi:hypothetical protein
VLLLLLLVVRVISPPRWFDFSVIAAMTLIAWGTALGLYGEHYFYDNVVHRRDLDVRLKRARRRQRACTQAAPAAARLSPRDDQTKPRRVGRSRVGAYPEPAGSRHDRPRQSSRTSGLTGAGRG